MSTPSTHSTRHALWQIDLGGFAVCAAMMLVVYLLGVQPLLDRRADAESSRRALSEKRQESADVLSALTTAKRELAGVEQALADTPLRLQPMGAVNQRLARMTALASEAGLTLNEIQPGKAALGTHYATVPIQVAGTGRFPTIVAFLNRLHTTFPDTGVTSFTLSGAPATPSAPVAFRIDLAWHAAPIDKAGK